LADDELSPRSPIIRQISHMPRVSVIVPTYDRAELVGETLDSIWAQTFHDYETIVVDDGSTDKTAELLAAFGNRIACRRIEHAGQGTARNAGLEIARGECIAFLDSDDLWQQDFLEKMIQALDLNPRAGFVFCDYATFDEQGLVRCAGMPPKYKLRGRLFGALLESDFICTGAILIRRGCFERVGGFDPRLPPVEDWDMWLRLAREYDAGYVDEPLVQIRLGESNASRNPAVVYPLNLQVLAKLRRDFPDEARLYRPVMQRQATNFHRALVKYFGAKGRPLPMLQHLGLMLAARYL
jgi:glycosyltransferase involved in cell wall biosynthesis